MYRVIIWWLYVVIFSFFYLNDLWTFLFNFLSHPINDINFQGKLNKTNSPRYSSICVVNRHMCTASYWCKYFKNFQTRPHARTRTTFNKGRCTGHFTFHEDLLEEIISHLQTDLKIARFIRSSFRVRWRIKIWSKPEVVAAKLDGEEKIAIRVARSRHSRNVLIL